LSIDDAALVRKPDRHFTLGLGTVGDIVNRAQHKILTTAAYPLDRLKGRIYRPRSLRLCQPSFTIQLEAKLRMRHGATF
jgi:hypothetical protein